MTRRSPLLVACLTCVLAVSGLRLVAQSGSGPATPSGQPPASAIAAPSTVDSAYLQLLHWRSVGPSRGGRVVAVAGDPVNKLTFYQGSTGGGVWKTDDGGLNWRNISDGFFNTGSVGAIAVAPSNTSIVYVGMGEACIRGNASYGDGVYRSNDGGKTWSHVGLDATRQIARVRVNPTNPDLVYVAALGDPWGPSPDRGVYRSKDGGRTWEKVLFRSDDAGAIDLVMDPTNADVLYASTVELRRYPWGFRSAGPGTALYKSTDGGTTWTDLTARPGLPTGTKGRIGITVAPSRPSRVWAIIDADGGQKGVYRSEDAGATWKHLTDDADLTQRPWYYHHIFADPKDPDTLWVLNVDLWRSKDGGTHFEQVSIPHGDNHDLWIDPADPQRMIEGNDGGATISFNGGTSWSTLLNQPTAQFYHVTADNQFPYRIYGAQQDNTTMSVPSRSDYGRITIEEWETVGGGEDGYVAPSRADANIVYAADHHFLNRYDRRTHQIRDISPNPETHYGWGGADINFRFWWTYPVMTSPNDPKTLYVTSQFVHRTTNEGQSWQIVSPDLTRHDPKTLEHTPSYTHPEAGEYWGPITREAYGPEWYATIFAFAESPAKAGVLWAGSDDGWVHVSQDNGKSWQKVTPPDIPEFALISIIEPSPHDPAVAYLAATRYKLQDNRPYLYKTADYGKTWTKITNGIPDTDFTRVIREDPSRRGLLYAGTETGVYVSFDDGSHWQSLRLNLPVVPIHDLIVQDGDLVAATHGRSFWILDNVALLRQFNQTTLAAPVEVFQPRTTIRFRAGGELAGSAGNNANDGQNPPNGVVIPFYVKDKPADAATLKIVRDKAGAAEVVRTITLQPADAAASQPASPPGRRGPSRAANVRAGANTFVWDMRYPGADELPGAVHQGRALGPLAAPGAYRVELTIGGRTFTEPFTITKDPRLTYSDADLEQQLRFLLTARDKLTETMGVVRQIREMRTNAEAMIAAAKKSADSARRIAALNKAMKDLNDKLYPLEERLVQYRARAGEDLINYPTGIDSKLARLIDFASMADAPPTDGEQDLLKRMTDGVVERAKALDAVKNQEFAALVKLAGSGK
ncbi:MAG TPA: hypothetical protein VG222_17580 [Vicinamibacterales bacterium]|nr:hypothetical protein [Vicinamibacterales bacterium]